jgi:dihydropteroate synthase
MTARLAMKQRPFCDLEIQGRTIRLGRRTLIMGVLNVTPDSFSDGGLYLEPNAAAAHATQMIEDGADWIDVGGESTRPGSEPVSAQEELARVLPVIRGIHKRFPSHPISIDTTKAEVAEQALRAGASIINDVSGLRFDPRLAEVARRHRAALVLMHLRGRPGTMQRRPFARDVWRSIREGLDRSIRRALRAGVRRSQIILDPGLGFGKTRRQNFEILAGLERLQNFRLPVLAGSSRKSFVQAIARGEGLDPRASRAPQPAAAWLWPLVAGKGATRGQASRTSSLTLQTGDTAAVVAAILGGAHIVRVHDVASIGPAVRMADAVLQALE